MTSGEPFNELTAETAYLFRHALVRDAAYELQAPSDRGKLHELAFHLIEAAFGGRAPEPPSLAVLPPPRTEPHATDAVAFELAVHARHASAAAGMQDARRLYLRRAAERAEAMFRHDTAIACLHELAELLEGPDAAECLRREAELLRVSGRAPQAEPLLLRRRKPSLSMAHAPPRGQPSQTSRAFTRRQGARTPPRTPT